MSSLKLFMLMLGCKPPGRLTEQHDIFFGIETSLKALIPHIKASWKEANGAMHIDAWREVTLVDNYEICIISKTNDPTVAAGEKLFFINLGGYKENEFEEYHYKILVTAKNKGEAIKKSKDTAFYKHCGFAGAVSHIDNKYGIDVDDLYDIEDVLSSNLKSGYEVQLKPAMNIAADKLHIGYLKLDKL